jgi:hypothetical protein
MSYPSISTRGVKATWGLWEAGTTAALFSLPTALHVIALQWAGEQFLDEFEWLVIGVALLSAFVLTMYAGGLHHARAFLSVGLITCCVWTFGGVTLGRDTGMASSHFVVALVAFVGQLNLVPIALLTDAQTANPHLSPGGRARSRKNMIGNIASVAAMDLFPLAYLLAPEGLEVAATVAWVALTATVAGAFAGFAAHTLHHAIGVSLPAPDEPAPGSPQG